MSYTSEVLADSPLAYWRLGETSGTSAADASGNGRTGSYNTATLGTPGAISASGDSDTAATFTGSAPSHVLVSNDAWMSGLSALTLEAWVKTDVTTGTRHILSRTTTSYVYGLLAIGTKAAMSVRAASLVTVTGSTTISDGAWHHVVGTWDGATVRLYVDGVADGSTALGGALVSNSNALAIASRSGLYFGGSIDEAAVYGTALSLARITAHRTAALTGPPPEATGTSSTTITPGATAAAVVATNGSTSTTITPAATATAVAVTAGSSTTTITATAAAGALGTTTGSTTIELTPQALADTVPFADGTASIEITPTAAAEGIAWTEGTSTTEITVGAIALEVYETTGLTGITLEPVGLVEEDGSTARTTITITPRALASTGPYTGQRGRVRESGGIGHWEPPVMVPPRSEEHVHSYVSAHAYTGVTMDQTRPVIDGLLTAQRKRQRDRVVVAGKDITYWRGIKTPLPTFGLVSPLLWGSCTLELPQIAAAFETPGHGPLWWLHVGAPVLIQRVGVIEAQENKVVATDYRGIILDFDINGRTLSVDVGGDALGRASVRDRQSPLFRQRFDLGRHWWAALAGPDGLARPFEPVGGTETGVKFYETGGVGYLDHLNDLGAKGGTIDGEQWTCTPYETGNLAGTYRVHRKNTETINATVYFDDAHTVPALQSAAAERPNRVFGTGVTPGGRRAKFGVYPALSLRQGAKFPNDNGRPMDLGDRNLDTDTGSGITALLHRLSVTGYLAVEDFAGHFDHDVQRAVIDLQEDVGLLNTGQVDEATWAALFDVDLVGYSTRGARIEPIVQRDNVRRLFRNASGQVVRQNPDYNPHVLVRDLTLNFGTDVTIPQMRAWARAHLAGEGIPGSHPSANHRHWAGTITFNTGALIAGRHNPGDPLEGDDLMPARALRPGMNIWAPHFDGGTLLHVATVDIQSETTVLVSVDTRARDSMTVAEVIARNVENRRSPARAWIRDHRSSQSIKDAVVEFDEIGGIISDVDLQAGWNVIPVVAGQEGTIAKLHLQINPPLEHVAAVFGKQVDRDLLTWVVPTPLRRKGKRSWQDEKIRRQLDEYVLLYTAGTDDQPLGYWPKTKTYEMEYVEVKNPDYPADDGDADETIDVERETSNKVPKTGEWWDDASYGYRTFDGTCVLWLAVYVRKDGSKLAGGRVLWPQLESGS